LSVLYSREDPKAGFQDRIQESPICQQPHLLSTSDALEVIGRHSQAHHNSNNIFFGVTATSLPQEIGAVKTYFSQHLSPNLERSHLLRRLLSLVSTTMTHTINPGAKMRRDLDTSCVLPAISPRSVSLMCFTSSPLVARRRPQCWFGSAPPSSSANRSGRR